MSMSFGLVGGLVSASSGGGGGGGVQSIESYIDVSTYNGGLIEAAKTGKGLIIKGNHDIGGEKITLASGQNIVSNGGVITFSGDYAIMPMGNNIIDGLQFKGKAGKFAIRVMAPSRGIQINNARTTDCSLISTNNGKQYSDIAWGSSDAVCGNILITNPIGEYTLEAQSEASFIVAQFVDGFVVTGGYAKKYKYAGYYWGGNSDPESEGGKENQRKCDNVLFQGFKSDDCWMAGLWGSMGINVEFRSCSASRSEVGGDVGFDHEGSINARTISCSAKNFQNGNFATFFLGDRHDILNCSSVQPGGYPHYRNYNSSLLAENAAIVRIEGCNFSRESGDTSGKLCSIDASNGPAKAMIIENNQLNDTSVTLTSTNNGDAKISGNTLMLTGNTASGVQVIRVHANYQKSIGDVSVSGNTLKLANGVSWVTGSTYIYIATSSYNQQRNVVVRNNDGPGGISINESGGNAGVSGIYFVFDNIVRAISRTNSGSKAMTLARSDGNYTWGTGAQITIA